jgi:hypothetical protein
MPDSLLILDESYASTLDESTPLDSRPILSLIYWTLSNENKTREQNTESRSRATNVPISSDVRPGPPTSGHTASRSKSDVLSIYHYQSLICTRPYSRTGRTSGPSGTVPPRKVDNMSRGSEPKTVENEQRPEEGVVSEGGLSDHDEMNGEERLDALNSPKKAGKRANSDVRMLFDFTVVSLYSNHLYPQSSMLFPQPKAKIPAKGKRKLRKLRLKKFLPPSV